MNIWKYLFSRKCEHGEEISVCLKPHISEETGGEDVYIKNIPNLPIPSTPATIENTKGEKKND